MTLRENECRLFEAALPANVQREIAAHKLEVQRRKEESAELLLEFDDFAARFFVEDLEADLVRPLAYLSGYINTMEVDVLHLDVADPQCAEIDGADMGFQILHPCAEGECKTKYQALFSPSQRAGATDFRRRFFHTLPDEQGENKSAQFLDILDGFMLHPQLRVEHQQLLQLGLSVLRRRFADAALPTSLPSCCTYELGWVALHQALQQDGYWLSAEELQRLALLCGCLLSVSTHFYDGSPPLQHEPLNVARFQSLHCRARVVFTLARPGSSRGHFSRLLTAAQWQELCDRTGRVRDENPEADASDADSCDPWALSSTTSSTSSSHSSSGDSSASEDTSLEHEDAEKDVEATAAEESILPDPICDSEGQASDGDDVPQDGDGAAQPNGQRCGKRPAAKEDDGSDAEAELDAFSDVSDNSDLFNVAIDEDLDYVTSEDQDLRRIEALKEHLRDYPLLPLQSGDEEATFMDVDSGQRLPMCHCAFRGCSASTTRFPDDSHWASEKWLYDHLLAEHSSEGREMHEIWRTCCQGKRHQEEMTLLAYYMAAVSEKEREHIPLIGASVDRRQLTMLHRVCRSKNVCGMVCFVCAQVHTHVASWDRMWKAPATVVGSDTEIKQKQQEWNADPCNRYRNWSQGPIRMWKVRDSLFCPLTAKDTEKQEKEARKCYDLNLLRSLFINRFASAEYKTHGPWYEAEELKPDNNEWQRSIRVAGKVYGKTLPFVRTDRVMCCPEDVERCRQCRSSEDEICGDCEVPLCKDCMIAFRYSPHVLPMGLCNDNLWGYTTSIIYQYKVRWLEAAIVSPAWTSMLVYYVEGDGGLQYPFGIPCVLLEYPFSIPSVSLQYPCRTSSVSLQYPLSIP